MSNIISLSPSEILAGQRTSRGVQFERFRSALAAKLRSDADLRAQANSAILAIRGVSAASVHSNQFLANMSLMYANDEFIGEQLMPVVTVSSRSDVYAVYPKKERLAFPDDTVGSERGRAAELNESRSSDNYSVKDYALQNFVSATTLENEDGAFDEMADLSMAVAEGLAFRRELRIAAIMTTGSNYAGNTAALSGNDQWSAPTTSDPVDDILTAKAALWNGMGGTELVCFSSLEVANALANHPVIADRIKYTQGGLTATSAIAQFFGFSRYLVGAARQDTANSGQTASYGRIWGKHFGIARVMTRPSKRIAAFGATFRMAGYPKSSEWFDPAVGVGGGYYHKQGVSEDHKVIAGDTGYLLTDVVA